MEVPLVESPYPHRAQSGGESGNILRSFQRFSALIDTLVDGELN